MSKNRHPRLGAPLWTLVAGTIIAGAVAVGHTWGDAVIAETVSLVVSTGYYFVAGRDTDIGAIYSRRSDERQHQVRLNASLLAWTVMIVTAFVVAVITVALGDNYWQADLIGGLGVVSYVLGLGTYGAHEDRNLETDGIMRTRHASDRNDNSGTRSTDRGAHQVPPDHREG